MVPWPDLSHFCFDGHCGYLRGDYQGSQKIPGWFTAWRKWEYSISEVIGIVGVFRSPSCVHFKLLTPGRATTETLDVQCTLLPPFPPSDITRRTPHIKGGLDDLNNRIIGL
jgi:hypothetical protein